MKIQVNGDGRDVRDRSTLSDLVAELSLAPARIAVELNHQVVRRDRWPETILSENDRIEIVHFVGGGSYRNRERIATGCQTRPAVVANEDVSCK